MSPRHYAIAMENARTDADRRDVLHSIPACLRRLVISHLAHIGNAKAVFRPARRVAKAARLAVERGDHEQSLLNCYQCGRPATWLAPDSRCGHCTRYTPEEIQGLEPVAKGYGLCALPVAVLVTPPLSPMGGTF